MYSKPSEMEPLLPTGVHELEDMSLEVVSNSSALGGQLHLVTQKAVIEFLRLINSYYSNLIEGHSTHPIDIERAMRQDYSNDSVERDLQEESLAHINCQRKVELCIGETPDLNIADSDFISWLHQIFYEQLPIELRQVKDEKSSEIDVVNPGEFRRREVIVGKHIGPSSENLPAFLRRFSTVYSPSKHHGIMPLIVIAASHHRLMWIHPFLDGNGRVTRLYTDACFLRLPLRGYGLWNVSRGLARQRSDYMDALKVADAQRYNDYDGRGNLSQQGLVFFCHFFLSTCLDQISFMNGLLNLDGLLDRINGYVSMRRLKLIPGPVPEYQSLKSEATYMLQEALLRGEVARGEMIRLSGMKDRTGRELLRQLLGEGLLVSDTKKGAVRINFPTHIANHLFPDLYPSQFV